jgi:Mitotic checkpoint regulator, MAD2B-interacting
MMVLVAYSESEGSEDEQPLTQAKKEPHPPSTTSDSKFTVDKSNPRKIKVNLQEIKAEAITNEGPDGPEGERAAKRPKVGGAFSGFNSMLPAPKRDTQATNGSKISKSTARKVFSLKTAAEPGFSRESDAELKELFAVHHTNAVAADIVDRTIDGGEKDEYDSTFTLPPVSESAPSKQGKTMMFKPLSVARNTAKKKKPPAKVSAPAPILQAQLSNTSIPPNTSATAPKVSLFSIGSRDEPLHHTAAQKAEYEPLLYQSATRDEDLDPTSQDVQIPPEHSNPPLTTLREDQPSQQSLDSIAADLNLSTSAKRQLLGRNHQNATKTSSTIINFNTDREYAANEALRASGEQLQHNPVRAIAPGKHSLKQLVSAASGQKEALEESFASGRRNKKEAGGRYGW